MKFNNFIKQGERDTNSTNNIIDCAKVVVYHAPYIIEGIERDKKIYTILEGNSENIELKVSPVYADRTKLRYDVKDKKIARVEDPLRDITHNAFEPGDCFLVYPDEKVSKPIARRSLRLVRLAEGIRDVNKLKLIEEKYPQLRDRVEELYSKISFETRDNLMTRDSQYLNEVEKQEVLKNIKDFKEGLDLLTLSYIDLDVEKEKVDKGILEEKIKEAESVSTQGKTENSIKALNDAIKAGKAINEYPEATKAQVDQAVEALTEAINGLEDKPLEETPIIRPSKESEVEDVKTKLQKANKEVKDLKAAFLEITIENREDEDSTVNVVINAEKYIGENFSLDKDVHVYHIGEEIEKVDGVIVNKEDKTVSFSYNKFSPFILTNIELKDVEPEPEVPDPEPEVPTPEPEKPTPSPNPNPSPLPTPGKPEKPGEVKKDIERLAGKNRYETSIEVSRKCFKTAETVIIARSDIYPDALSASMLSKVKKSPILLTPSDKLLEIVEKEIQRLGAKNVIIVGGDMAISKDVEKSLDDYKIERLAGKDRFETSANIARKLAKENNIRGRAIIASGEVWADALAAGSFAGKENHPILLVKKDRMPEAVDKAIKDLGIKEVYIVGGSARISEDIKNSFK